MTQRLGWLELFSVIAAMRAAAVSPESRPPGGASSVAMAGTSIEGALALGSIEEQSG